MTLLYFTSTGNSLYAAKKFHGERHAIPQLLKSTKRYFKDDSIGIVVPCYYFGIPRPVEEFLKETTLDTPYLFGILTYGGYLGNAFRLLEKNLSTKSVRFSYLNKVAMVDNYLPLFDMKKELESLPSRNVDQCLESIVTDVEAKKAQKIPPNPLQIALTKYWQKKYRNRLKNAYKNFSVNPDCNLCGICKSVCPVDNIVLESAPLYSHKCIECCACAHHCPRNAITITGEKNHKARFICNGVALSEIVAANQ